MCWCFEGRDAGWRIQAARRRRLRVQPSASSVCRPARAAAPGPDVVVWTSADGRAAAVTEAGQPIAALQALLDAGRRVVRLDVFGQGPAVKSNRLVENRAAAAYTFGYNPPLVVQRAHDTLAALRYARSLAGSTGRVTLVALDGHVLGVGRPGTRPCRRAGRRGGVCHRRVPLRVGDHVEDAAFLPGGAKYGDLPAVLTLAAPQPLWLAGEPPESIALLKDAYRAAGSAEGADGVKGLGNAAMRDAIAWVSAGAH